MGQEAAWALSMGMGHRVVVRTCACVRGYMRACMRGASGARVRAWMRVCVRGNCGSVQVCASSVEACVRACVVTVKVCAFVRAYVRVYVSIRVCVCA